MVTKYRALPALITVKEAARLLGICKRSVHNYISDCIISSVKIGRLRKIHTLPLLEYYRIDRDEALRVLNS